MQINATVIGKWNLWMISEFGRIFITVQVRSPVGEVIV